MEFMKTIYEHGAVMGHPVNHPLWWITILKFVKEDNEIVPKEEMQPWLTWQTSFQTFSARWNRLLKKWQVSSWTTFAEKWQLHRGDTSQMFLSQPIMDKLVQFWNYCATVEEIDEKDCLDLAQKMTISTSSTTVAGEGATADVSSRKKLHLTDFLTDLGSSSKDSSNSRSSTGTMFSSISTLKSGENVVYGLTEQVGDFRLTVIFIKLFRIKLIILIYS